MVLEDGIDWKPAEPRSRGRYKSFADAVAASVQALSLEKNGFFDSLADRWRTLFPSLPAVPGRYSSGTFVLYVKSAPALFSVRPRLAAVRKKLLSLEGAPRRIDILLEIRK